MSQAPDVERRLFLLERKLQDLERGSQYAIPERRGSLREKLLPNALFLGERRMSNVAPSTDQVVIWDDDSKIWIPGDITPNSFPTFPSTENDASHYRLYWIDFTSVAGFSVASADTLADPDAAAGTYNASTYYLNLGYYDTANGNLIGRTEGWFTPSPANLGAADTAAGGAGPYFHVNADSGVGYAADPSLNTKFIGFIILYFGLGDGTGQPLRVETGAGAPTHSTTEGTLYCNRTSNILYMNTDGGTTWAAVADPTQLHVREHDMTGASDHTATAHRIFYSDTNGDIQALAFGTDNTVLTSTGASTAPEWGLGGGVKRAGGYFPLPLAVGAGITLTKSASANTLGGFTTIATPTGDGYIMGVVVEDFSAANNYAYMVIDASPRFVAADGIEQTVLSATLTADVGGMTLVANDILIASIISKNNVESITVPAGWTKFVEVNWGATDEHRSTIAWYRVVGGETTFNFSKITNDGNLLALNITQWRGCATSGSPISGTATTSDNASADSVTYATFTPGYTGDLVVAVGFYADDQTTLAAITGTDPTFVTNADVETASGSDASIFAQSGPSFSGFPTGARSHTTTSTADATNLGVLFGLNGGGSAIVKLSATATAATGQYESPLAVPVLFKKDHIIRGAWAGNNAVADTCVVSLSCAGGLQDV